MTEQIDFLPGFSSWGMQVTHSTRSTPAQSKTLLRAGSYYSARDRVFHDGNTSTSIGAPAHILDKIRQFSPDEQAELHCAILRAHGDGLTLKRCLRLGFRRGAYRRGAKSLLSDLEALRAGSGLGEKSGQTEKLKPEIGTLATAPPAQPARPVAGESFRSSPGAP